MAALLCAGAVCAQANKSPDPSLTAADYALSGQLLLAQGRIAEALLALETALLLNPDLPGAQLDYAQALAESGQGGAARSIASQALGRPDAPPGLKAALLAALTSPPNLQFSAYVQWSQGNESNINNAISAQFLTLQLPNGPVDLPLSDTERPRAAPVRKSQAGAHVSLALPVGELQLGGNLMDRTPRGDEAFATTSTEASIGYSLPLARGRIALQASRQQLKLGRESQFEGRGLQLQYDITMAGGLPCTFSPRIGQVSQQYPNSVLTDGTFSYARLQATCLHGGSAPSAQPQPPAAQTQFAIGLGTDTPQDSTRPGAERQRQELLLRHERSAPVGLPGQLSAWVRWHHTQDSKPYSPLFGSLVASTHAVGVGAGYWVPMGHRISLGVELESTRQASNIGLYAMENQAAYVGLRWFTP